MLSKTGDRPYPRESIPGVSLNTSGVFTEIADKYLDSPTFELESALHHREQLFDLCPPDEGLLTCGWSPRTGNTCAHALARGQYLRIWLSDLLLRSQHLHRNRADVPQLEISLDQPGLGSKEVGNFQVPFLHY